MCQAEELGGGRNSRVFRVYLDSATSVAVKVYSRVDRLQTEFAALEFLWANGVHIVPQPLAANPELGCAAYQFIAGTRVHPSGVSHGDIDAAVSFLGTLRGLCIGSASRGLPPASEACFTFAQVFANIETRLHRLANLPDTGEPWRQLHGFLAKDLLPELAAVRRWIGECGANLWSTPLAEAWKTLSPSDFGFHNALRQSGGNLVFLDFEHFGWDDPAKMAADFLLHPHEAMAISPALRARFHEKLVARFDRDGTWLAERIRIALPLYGLKWCAILLNEFVPRDLARRRFAGCTGFSSEDLLLAQLEKARAMLHRSHAARTRTFQEN